MAKLVHALHEHTSHGASNRSSTSTNGKYSGGKNIKQAHMAEGGGGLREAGGAEYRSGAVPGDAGTRRDSGEVGSGAWLRRSARGRGASVSVASCVVACRAHFPPPFQSVTAVLLRRGRPGLGWTGSGFDWIPLHHCPLPAFPPPHPASPLLLPRTFPFGISPRAATCC
jgi:hypothetical protein